MGQLLKYFKKYLNETPEEQLEKDWEELKKWNSVGPNVLDWLLFSKCQNQIDKISQLEEDWDYYGGVVPSEIVIGNARNFVSLIFNNGYKVFDEENVYPTPYGTIIVDIEPKEDYFISIEIGNKAIGWFTKYGKGNYPEELMMDIIETDFHSLPKELTDALDKLYETCNYKKENQLIL